jgi:DNA-binding GntR family transcriptional regulator
MSATDEAYATLRAGILGGRYEPGARLGEVELSESLGVSRTPVREALRQLAADGLVKLSSNRGVRVSTWTDDELRDGFELRALLEPYGARRAATRIGDAELDRLEGLCQAMERLGARGRDQDLDRLSVLNADLHQSIVTASGNTKLVGVVGSVVSIPVVIRTFHRYSDSARERSHRHHRELVAAFRARDPDWAESVMRSHIHAARNVLLPTTEKEEPS